MKIYLDYIFIENIIINFVIMYQVTIFTKSKINIIRCISSSIIFSIYSVIIYFFYDTFILTCFIKLMLVNISIFISFKPKNIKEYLKKIIYYYIINFIYVGVIISITVFFKISINNTLNKICIYIISGGITYLFNRYLWKLWKTNIKNNSLGYKLKIKNQEINCYVDTGNLVYNLEHNLDVIFLDYNWYGIFELLDILNTKIDLKIKTVNGNEKLYGYIVKGVEVYKENRYICKLDKIIFSFSNQRININNKYSGLIGYNLYVEKLEGVKL